MRFRIILLSLLLPLLVTKSAHAQSIPPMSMDGIMKTLSSKDTVYIINFWATWCAPCVEELPVFNDLERKFSNRPVKVVLVSLDFKEDYKVKLPTFLQRKKIAPSVIWLSDTNPNEFVPKVDNSWQGSIPATLVIKPHSGQRRFFEGQVTVREVSAAVEKLLKQK